MTLLLAGLLISVQIGTFAYCDNNPTNNFDPSGYFNESLYGFKWYFGGKKYGNGFTINVNSNFKRKSYCLKYAKEFLEEHGSGRWVKKYYGMDKTRIAAEIWFHVVVYYIGNKSYLAGILRTSISKIDEIIRSANPITVNSKDSREVFFWLAWYGVSDSKLPYKPQYIIC